MLIKKYCENQGDLVSVVNCSRCLVHRPDLECISFKWDSCLMFSGTLIDFLAAELETLKCYRTFCRLCYILLEVVGGERAALSDS